MSGPIDPRLWHRCASARRYLILAVVCEVAMACCTLASAVVLAGALAGLITEPATRHLADMSVPLGQLAVLTLARTAAHWAQARFGDRAATGVGADLGDQVLTALAHTEPRRLHEARESAAIVLTRGLDDLRVYFTGYLPAVFSAAVLTPAAALLIAASDVRSAFVVAVTVPLIPVFMILIGQLTRDRASAALAATVGASGQILDLIAGIPTLRALGRTATPLHRIRELGAVQRRSAMATLRVAFLSGMVLELIATLSVALVAVSIGMRLVFGGLGLATALTVLILAPEVYWPLRRVGVQFHAAADGKAVFEKAFDLLDTAAATPTPHTDPATTLPPHRAVIAVEELSIADRFGHAPSRLTATILPGRVTVLTGPNGVGKSTVLHAIAGLTVPESGKILIGDIDLRTIDRDHWWARVGWLPQRPVLVAGTIRENLELFGALCDVEGACADSQFDDVLQQLPNGLDTFLGTGGVGLSLGERQRLCLTRVLATDRPLLLLDEPTAHLDAETEEAVLAAIVSRARRGSTVLLAGHRTPVLAVADEIVTVEAGHATPV